MGPTSRNEPGNTLALPVAKGLADLRLSALAYTLRRAALTAAVVSALVAAVAAVSAAAQGRVIPGAITEPVGGVVLSVSPTGLAWQQGIRPGQHVAALVFNEEQGGWELDTTDGTSTFVARTQLADEGLQASLPIGILGLALASLGGVFLRTRRSWALPAATTAFLAASTPLAIRGDPELSTLALTATVLLPGLWMCANVRAAAVWKVLAIVILGTFTLVWAMARIAGSDLVVWLDPVRGGLAYWGTAALVLDRIVLPVFSGQPMRLTRPRVLDVAIVAGTAALALALLSVFSTPPVVVAGLLVMAAFVVPVVRQRFGPSAKNLLFADIHDQAASEATEQERARLARDLHDVPLQELAAVIRNLDIVPGAEDANERLREVVSHLRNVASDLRPPVLDDFGLPAALSYLAEQSSTPTVPVVTAMTDHTGLAKESRPPADVELAFFRIASEAVSNALRHADAHSIRIDADIEPRHITLQVLDDGRGFDPARARAAAGQRFGLGTMRRRAEAIDAEISIDGAAHGTAVRVSWQA